MRDKHYKIKCIRIDEKIWEDFKKKRKESGLSWNKFIEQLCKKNKH